MQAKTTLGDLGRGHFRVRGTDMRIGAIAFAAVVAGQSATLHAHAAETEITLSCNGTMKVMPPDVTPEALEKATPWAITNMGLVINLAGHTVSFAGTVGHIDSADASIINFSDYKNIGYSLGPSGALGTMMISGDIDRVTGAFEFLQTTSYKTEKTPTSFSYDLLCKPTARLF